MEIFNVEEKTISGFSIRTSNAKEFNSATAQIGKLFQRFDKSVAVDYKGGAREFSVYFNYESDVSGEYSVLMGADKIVSSSEELASITIPAGKYLKFSANGDIPKIVIDTWSQIWKYFSSPDVPHQRAYTIDFEQYKSQLEVEIYIAIK